MVDFDDQTISLSTQRSPLLLPEELDGWIVRRPSPAAKRWSVLNGLVHGLVWVFPFVTVALLWRRAIGPDGSMTGPWSVAAIGMVLLILRLLLGVLAPYTWWFAFREDEAIIEHGLVFRRRDHVAFERVQFLGRRAGPIMRGLGVASLAFDTAAGRATIPAALSPDIDALELRVRAAMQRATVL